MPKKTDMYSEATNVLQFKLRMFPTFLLAPQKNFILAAVFFLYLPGFLHSSSSSRFLQSSSSTATKIPNNEARPAQKFRILFQQSKQASTTYFFDENTVTVATTFTP
jgi:hypothetical protein